MSQIARGSKLEVSIATVYTEVDAVNNLVSSKTRDTIETSHLTSGKDRTYVAGLGDAEWSFELNYDRGETTHATLEDAADDGTPLNCRITRADGSTDTGTFIVTQFQVTLDREDVQKASVTLQRSGGSTLA